MSAAIHNIITITMLHSARSGIPTPNYGYTKLLGSLAPLLRSLQKRNPTQEC